MIILKFKAEGQTLMRTDMRTVVAQARNELYAEFTLDEVWAGKEPITAQFSNGGTVIDVFVEDGKCLIPWEVLQDRGILSVCLIGGDLITTNTVDISILGTGVIGGLVPTAASPSVYSYIVDNVKRFLDGDFSDVNIEAESLTADNITAAENINAKNITAVNDINAKNITSDNITSDNITVKEVIYSDGSIYAECVNANGAKAIIDLGSKTGIRLMNNVFDKKDFVIKIGRGYETDDEIEGICYSAEEGFRVGKPTLDRTNNTYIVDILRLSPNDNGIDNFIKGNETLKILSNDGNNGKLSFDSTDAGIEYKKATWTERFKQLDVMTDKGINMEALNNSYWWVNAEKKAVYGNKLNKLEFRANDGVAKFSNVVNAKDYQIGGTPLMDKVAEVAESVNTRMSYKAYVIMNAYNSFIEQAISSSRCTGMTVDNYTEYMEFTNTNPGYFKLLKPSEVLILSGDMLKTIDSYKLNLSDDELTNEYIKNVKVVYFHNVTTSNGGNEAVSLFKNIFPSLINLEYISSNEPSIYRTPYSSNYRVQAGIFGYYPGYDDETNDMHVPPKMKNICVNGCWTTWLAERSDYYDNVVISNCDGFGSFEYIYCNNYISTERDILSEEEKARVLGTHINNNDFEMISDLGIISECRLLDNIRDIYGYTEKIIEVCRQLEYKG